MNLQTSAGKIQERLSDFGRLTLADYVEEDPRPSFVVDLKSVNTVSPVSSIAFINKAFRAAKITLEDDNGQIPRSTSTAGTDLSASAFIAWAKRTQLSGFFQYQEHSWTATTLFSRWRIITGESTRNDDEPAEVVQAKRPRIDPENRQSEPASDVVQITNLPEKWKLGRTKPGPLDVLRFADSASREHCCLVQNFDWSQTSLGPMQSWSATTLNTVMYMLCNTDPCVIFWGPERTIVYNEAYISLIGALHPAALGASAKVNFGSFWPPFERLVQGMEQTGFAAKQDTYRSVLNRFGVPEELWFRGTFVPIFNPDGQICGIFNHVVEITNEVLSSRRMKTLLKVTEETSTMIAPDRLWQGILASMQLCAADLPFVAIYSTGRGHLVSKLAGSTTPGVTDSGDWYLEGSVGFPQGHPATLSTLKLQQDTGLAPALRLLLASNTGRPLMIRKTENLLPVELFRIQTDREHEIDISEIVLCSLSPSSGKNTVCLAFAILAEQRYDEEYQQFLSLLSHRLEDMATSAFLLQKERIRTEQAVAEAERQQEWLSKQLVRQTKEAQASEFRFYKFAEHAPVAVYILGPDGDVRFGNNAWYDFLGLSPDDDSLVPWLRNIHPDDLEKVDVHWQQMRKGMGQESVEFRVVKSNDGNTTTTYLKATAFPESDEYGKTKSVTGIITDWSAQKSQELAVTDRLAEALEAKRAQENFMDMVSHEMRNPLSAMLQCAEEVSQTLALISEEKDTAKPLASKIATMKEAVDTIQWCGRHQRQIIDDVLTISKLDSDLLTLAPLETKPATVIEQVLKMFASEANAAEIQVSRSISSDSKRQFCVFDSSRVLQILINLVGNAIKFTKDQPIRKLALSVDISSTEPQVPGTKFVSSDRKRRRWPAPADPATIRYILYTVKDTGPGLTTEEKDSLFARFKQASPRTHAQYGGSGLGLFISRELAEMHGGKIGLNSKVGVGSTFSFYVETHLATNRADDLTMTLSTDGEGKNIASPIETGRPNLLPSDTALAPSPSSITLLIVEDNLINQKVLVRQIRKLGFKTVTANHGQEALKIIESSTWWYEHNNNPSAIDISVVLCDLEMPVMDGMTCIRRIRQWQVERVLRVHVPVIAVTGNARIEQVNAAREAGFDDVICKPYSVPDLVPMIYRLTNASP